MYTNVIFIHYVYTVMYSGSVYCVHRFVLSAMYVTTRNHELSIPNHNNVANVYVTTIMVVAYVPTRTRRYSVAELTH